MVAIVSSLLHAVRLSGLASPRCGSATFLFILLVVWTAYLSAPLPHVFLIALFLIPFVLSLASPVWAVILLVGLNPLVDGLIAWAWHGSFLVHRKIDILWSEPLLLGVLLGSLLHQIAQKQPAVRLPHAVYFYAAVIVCSALVSVQATVAEEDYGFLWFVRRMWEAIPFQHQASPLYTLRASLLFLIAPACIWLVRSAVTQPSQARLIWLSWLGGASLADLYGLWAWSNQHGYFWPRIEALFDDVNAHGSYQVLTFFIAWSVFVSERSRIVRSFAATVLGLTVIMLLLSGSRIAILATLMGLSVILVLWHKPHMVALFRSLVQFLARLPHMLRDYQKWWQKWWQKRWAVLAGVALVGIILTSVPVIFGSKAVYIYGIQPTISSVTNPYFLVRHFQANRQAVWSASARAFLESPTLGMGPGTIFQRLGQYYRSGDSGWKPAQENTHNYFLHVAAETGILGIVGLGWLIGACVCPLFRNQHSKLSVSLVPRILVVGAIAYLFTALTGHPLLLSRQLVLFWSYLGVLSILSGSHSSTKSTRICSIQTPR